MERILGRNDPERTKCKIKELSVLGKIGKGSFGEVFLVEHQATREQYALKQMTREKEAVEAAAATVTVDPVVAAQATVETVVAVEASLIPPTMVNMSARTVMAALEGYENSATFL